MHLVLLLLNVFQQLNKNFVNTWASQVFQHFGCICQFAVHISRDRSSSSRGRDPVAGGIVVVGALTRCALLHSVCNLKVS